MNNEEFDFQKEAEPFMAASEQVDDKMRGFFAKVSKWRSMIVLGIMALTVLILPLVSAGLVNPFSTEFVFNALYNLALATSTYYIFSPFGVRSERLESRTYFSAISRWTELSDRVRNEGLIEAFYHFCGKRCDEEREEIRTLYISAAGLPLSIYEEKYKGLTKNQLKELKEKGELTGRQLKYLAAANSDINVAPINPFLVLSGLKLKNINDVGRRRRKKWMDYLKPATIVLTMLVRTAITISGNQDVEILDYLTQTVMDLFVVATWAFTGFRYGVSLVRDEEQIVQGRSEFLGMFLERQKKKGEQEIKEIEKTSA